MAIKDGGSVIVDPLPPPRDAEAPRPMPAGMHPTGGPIKLTHDWPVLQGPNGNFTSATSGVRLLDDLSHARLVWQSEEPAVTGVRSSPIVYDGRVYVSYFVPNGAVADDVMIAIDAATGKTVWKRVFAGKGVNNQHAKRDGWGVTPVAFDGKVFAAGTSGLVYALDAKTGAPLWEKETAIRAAILGGAKPPMLEGLTYGDGALIVPDFKGGVRAHDPSSGALLWEKSNVAAKQTTPSRVRLGNRDYLLVGNAAGEMRLLDPKTGAALWTVAGLAPFAATIVATDKHAFALKAIDTNRGYHVAYRITSQGAQQAWRLPDRPDLLEALGGDHDGTPTVAAKNGLVYFIPDGAPTGRTSLAIVREDTGELLLTKEELAGFDVGYVFEDRYFLNSDVHHGTDRGGSRYNAYPLMPSSSYALMGRPWAPPHESAHGYEVPIVEPFVDGFLFGRTLNAGLIRAYDLRHWEGSYRAPVTPFANLPPPAGAEALQRLDTGERFNWVLNPVWWPAKGQLLVPDYRENRIWTVAPSGRAEILREELEYPQWAAADGAGNIIAPGNKRISLIAPDGRRTTLAEGMTGNDGVMRSDGTLYISTGFELVRFTPSRQKVSHGPLMDAQGLALSKDEKTLFVASQAESAVLKYPVNADGSVGPRAVHLDLKALGVKPRSLCVDDENTLYLAAGTLLHVFDSAGQPRAKYWTGGYGAMGCTFGDADRKTLYVNTRAALYTKRMSAPGLP